VVVESPASLDFEVSEAELLLEFLIVAFDAPAQLARSTRRSKIMSSGSVESQYLVGSVSPLGHSIKSISLARLVAMSGTHAHAGKREVNRFSVVRPLPPADGGARRAWAVRRRAPWPRQACA